jgi:hypothetical protein
MEGCGPYEWQVEITGLANSNPVDCPDCAELDGSYVLTWTGRCTWQYDLAAAVCGVVALRLQLGAYVAPLGWPVSLALLDGAGQSVMWLTKYYPSRLECMAISGESLGRLELPWLATTCDVSGSEVSLTVLRPCGA